MHLFVTLICLLFGCFAAIAAEDIPADRGSRSYSGWVWQFDPGEQRYPDYIADPRRPRMMIGVATVDSEIPQTSDGRVMVDAGARYTILEVQNDPSGLNKFALDIEGGLFTQFDLINSTDFIGWDGRYALFLVYDRREKFAVRFGSRHISCHLGDEYMEASGRSRINYIRDDLALGLSYHINEGLDAPICAWALKATRGEQSWEISHWNMMRAT